MFCTRVVRVIGALGLAFGCGSSSGGGADPGQVVDTGVEKVTAELPVVNLADHGEQGADLDVQAGDVTPSEAVGKIPSMDVQQFDVPGLDVNLVPADSTPKDAMPVDVVEAADSSPEAVPLTAPVEWLLIPGGTFLMGSTASALCSGGSCPTPVHSVSIPAFYMAKTEVTVAEYQSCVTAAACMALNSGCTQGPNDGPVCCVTWYESKAYCAWTGGRLCSEAEWEYAARDGNAGNLYPWGNTDPICDDAVWTGPTCSPRGPAEGCSEPTGNDAWGVCDLAGNAWEWVEDDCHNDYAGAPTDGNAWVDNSPPLVSCRVVRGGSFTTFDAANLRGSGRGGADPMADDYDDQGARCCKDR